VELTDVAAIDELYTSLRSLEFVRESLDAESGEPVVTKVKLHEYQVRKVFCKKELIARFPFCQRRNHSVRDLVYLRSFAVGGAVEPQSIIDCCCAMSHPVAGLILGRRAFGMLDIAATRQCKAPAGCC